MDKKSMRERLLASTIIAGAVAIASPAIAQTPTAGQPGNPLTDPSEAGASTGPIEGQTPASGSPDVAGSDGDSGTIIVTGSRIPQPNLKSVAPVTVLSAQEIKLQGTTRVEDLLNSLPQVFADQGGSISNGASGTATVNLRGLGASRTLVLVNGRRLLPGDPTDSAADLNAIPDALVKRVEVQTGGASSTYGADAVAGVVNFIMDTDYTGIRLDSQYSLFQHNNRSKVLRAASQARIDAGTPGYQYPDGNTVDGGAVDATLTMGAGFDDNRGHVVGYFGYRKQKAVAQDSRDYSSCTPQATSTADASIICGGSIYSAEGNFADSTSNYYHTDGNNFTPGITRYNFAPTNYYQRPDERYSGGFFAHYDVSDAIKPYMEFMFMDDRTKAQIAPSGDFANTLTVNCDNPLLSAQQLAIVCRPDNLVNGFLGTYPLTGLSNTINPGAAPINFSDPITGAQYNQGFLQVFRRNVEGGPRVADLEHTEYRGVIGSKGRIDNTWSYDAYYQYGRTVYSQQYTGEFSTLKLNRALDVVNNNGTIQCRSVETNLDPACVPYNIFQTGGVTADQVNYLTTSGFQRGIVSEQVASATFTGLLGNYGLKSPLANDGLTVNFGAEYRKEKLDLETDNEFTLGDLTGQGSATLPIHGSFHVIEGFGEALLPVVQDNFIYSLTLSGGYRYSSYTLQSGSGFKTSTYKLGVDFAPIKDLTLRGSYNRAVRAPNIQELFATNHVALDGSSDPCAGAFDTDDDGNVLNTINGNTLAQCRNTFRGNNGAQLSDSLFGNITPNPSSQYNGLVGGNTSLRPEVATTKTFGVILQPRFLPRLAVTVDYYDIKIKKVIAGIGADTILAACAASGDPTVCGFINRNPVNGSLWLTQDGYVTDLPLNLGSYKTKGIDVNASYAQPLGEYGSLGFSVVGTYLDKFTTDPGIPGITPYDCAGYFGLQCGTPNPRWRHKARVTYTAPNGFGLSLQWRYFSRVKVDASSGNPTLNPNGANNFSLFGAKIPSQSYFDLVSTIKVGDHYNLRLGVNNLMDKRPPLISANGALSECPAISCNGGTFPQVYDALGRYIFAGFSLDF